MGINDRLTGIGKTIAPDPVDRLWKPPVVTTPPTPLETLSRTPSTAERLMQLNNTLDGNNDIESTDHSVDSPSSTGIDFFPDSPLWIDNQKQPSGPIHGPTHENLELRREADRANYDAMAAADLGSFTPLQSSVPRWDELIDAGVNPTDARKLGDTSPAVIDALVEGEISTEFALFADDPAGRSDTEILELLEIGDGVQTPEDIVRTQELISVFIGHEGPLVDDEDVRSALRGDSNGPDVMVPLLPDLTKEQQSQLDVLTDNVGSEQWSNYISEADVGLRASGVGYADYTTLMLGLGFVNGNALERENGGSTLGAGSVALSATGEVLDVAGDYVLIPAPAATAKALSGLGFALSAGSIVHEAANGEFGNSVQDGFEGASLLFGGASFVVGGPPGWILGGASVVTGLISLLFDDNEPPGIDDPVQDVLDFQFNKQADSDVGVTQQQRAQYGFERARYVETSLLLTEERLWSQDAKDIDLDAADDIEYKALWVHANNENRYVEPGKHVDAERAGRLVTYIFRETDLATGEEYIRQVFVYPDSDPRDRLSDQTDLQNDIDAAAMRRAESEPGMNGEHEVDEAIPEPAPQYRPGGHTVAPTNDPSAPSTSVFSSNSNVNNAGVPGPRS